MRCEIQIQTILNHAWAETEHDILYKRPGAQGFGSKAFQSIEKRMARLMDEYLLPAGYELQKVQYDYERLMQGKALVDRGTLEVLAQCKDNNNGTISCRPSGITSCRTTTTSKVFTATCPALLLRVQVAKWSKVGTHSIG